MEFRLTSVSYEARTGQIMASYLIRTNVSNSYSPLGKPLATPLQIVPAFLTVDIECRSSESDQQWRRVIQNQTVSSHYISSSTSMLPRTEPKPGSFVRCSAQATTTTSSEASDEQHLVATANLLIEPAPVVNLFMKRLNQTALELAWLTPAFFYDYVDMLCFLDEPFQGNLYGHTVYLLYVAAYDFLIPLY